MRRVSHISDPACANMQTFKNCCTSDGMFLPLASANSTAGRQSLRWAGVRACRCRSWRCNCAYP
eukprot:1399699-Prymnesium_polylepis.3